MSKRVTNVVVEFCVLTVYYSDCTSVSYDISGCTDTTPEPKKPGDWPAPDPVADVVCRVAIKVGEQAAQRLNNYLSGILLTGPLANLPALYSAAKIAEYGWSIALYDAMYGFYWNGVFAGGGNPGNDAKIDWDANSAAITAAVQEALYCSLPSTGEITEQILGIWAAALDGMGTEFFSLLSDLLLIWPLAQLRELAFNASTTTDAVSCAAFDCEGGGFAGACDSADFVWTGVAATPAQWEGVNGSVDTNAWTGEEIFLSSDITTGIFQSEAARNPNETWRRTAPASPILGDGTRALRYMAITYTPDSPCVVTSLSFGSLSNSGSGSKMMAVAVQLMDDSWTVLKNIYFTPAPQTDSPGLSWSGTPVTVKQIMWITGHYRGTSAVTVQIRDCKINV